MQISLNDLLMVGPTIQQDFYSILIRFRFHKFVVTADIEKMYRQVLIDEADRNFQLVLWRENPSECLRIYRLNTVTNGTSSAPFQAIRCLIYLSNLYQEKLPVGSKIIRNDFYVDYLSTGADNLNDIANIRQQTLQDLYLPNGILTILMIIIQIILENFCKMMLKLQVIRNTLGSEK